MYFILPESEKRSLEDIELHYSDDSKKITDIHIRINKDNNQNYWVKKKTIHMQFIIDFDFEVFNIRGYIFCVLYLNFKKLSSRNNRLHLLRSAS